MKERAPLVVDASVTLNWALREPVHLDKADHVLAALPTHRLLVPSLWSYEVSSVMLVRERQGHLSVDEREVFLGFLRVLPIEVDESGWKLAFGRLFELANKHSLKIPDAAYLELALRRQAPLAAVDNKLNAAAEAEGVAFSWTVGG